MIYINILVNENSNYMLLVLPSWFDYFCSHDFLSVLFCCCTRSITFWPGQSSICSYYFYSWFTINNSFNLPNALLNIINWQYFGNIGLNILSSVERTSVSSHVCSTCIVGTIYEFNVANIRAKCHARVPILVKGRKSFFR